MRTKIAYILVSNEKDIYLEQAIVSIYSFRLHNPNADLYLIVDKSTSETLTSGIRKEILKYITNLVVVDVPDVFSNMQKSRFIKTSLRKHIEGDFLFIDTDTVICGKLDDIDNCKNELAAVPDQHIPIQYNWLKHSIRKWSSIYGWKYSEDNFYFNSGVMLVKDTEDTRQFYEHWHSLWMRYAVKGINYDQPSLAKANELMGFKLCKLDDVWNCQICANGLPFLGNAKIIHYFASGIGSKKDVPYRFLDNKLFERIKMNGKLDDSIKALIDNAKYAFNPFCSVIGFDDAKFLYSHTYWLYAKHPIVYKAVEFFSRSVLFLSRCLFYIKRKVSVQN